MLIPLKANSLSSKACPWFCHYNCRITMWKIMCFWTKSKNKTTTKQKIKHKNPCRSRELNPATLADKADALPLHHGVNWEYRLIFNCFNAMGQNVNKQRRICGHTFSTNTFFLSKKRRKRENGRFLIFSNTNKLFTKQHMRLNMVVLSLRFEVTLITVRKQS